MRRKTHSVLVQHVRCANLNRRNGKGTCPQVKVFQRPGAREATAARGAHVTTGAFDIELSNRAFG